VGGEAESLQGIGVWMSHAGSKSGGTLPIVSTRECGPILPKIALLWKTQGSLAIKVSMNSKFPILKNCEELLSSGIALKFKEICTNRTARLTREIGQQVSS
jgi:hypothetical protein